MPSKKSAPKKSSSNSKSPKILKSTAHKVLSKTVGKQAAAEKKKSAPAPAGAEVVQELDAEEVDAQQEAEEMAVLSASGGGSSGGLDGAPKAGATEISVSLKNFRHHPDMENFYRFIYENDLRFEALEILDQLFHEKELRKLTKTAKAKAN